MTKDNTVADSILSAAVFVSDYFPVWVRLWVLTVSRKRKPSQSLYAKGLLWVKKRIKCGSTIFLENCKNGENHLIFAVFWSY